jgi:hypothetical protein
MPRHRGSRNDLEELFTLSGATWTALPSPGGGLGAHAHFLGILGSRYRAGRCGSSLLSVIGKSRIRMPVAL